MKKFFILFFAVLAVVISYNCQKSAVAPNPSNVKISLPDHPYDYSHVNTQNGTMFLAYEDFSLINSNKATIGRVLFYDKALSINNTVSCATCHKQANAFADPTALSKGFEEKLTVRNSIGINNLQDEVAVGYFWDARETKIESMVFAPIANHIEMGFERIDLITEKIGNLPYYKDLFSKYYGDRNITTQRLRESLGNFLFSIVSANSKFDRASLNGFQGLTSQEIRGLNLFVNNNCNTCHLINNHLQSGYGGNSGGGRASSFANNGLDVIDADKGINGEYKIPRLKNITKTGPYMHDGRFKTLEEVLDHYSNNIKNNPKLSPLLKDFNMQPLKMGFSDQDKKDLMAFFKTLDDEVLTTDIKYSSPFID